MTGKRKADRGRFALPRFQIRTRSVLKFGGARVGAAELRGLARFCEERGVARCYAVTRDAADFGLLSLGAGGVTALKIPAALACFWLGRSEVAD